MILSLLLAAVTLTPTPTPTEILPTPTKNVSSEVLDIVKQKVSEKLKQITSNNVSPKQGLIGKVVEINPLGLTIEIQTSTKKMSLASDVTIIDLKRNKTKVENLKVGQDVLAMADYDSTTDSYTAKRIVFVNPKEIENPHQVVVGKIVDISRSSPVFSLIPIKNKNTQFQIKTDSKTEIVDSSNQKITLTDLKSGHKIIAIIIPDPKMSKTYYVKKIIDQDYTPAPTPTPKQ